MPRIFLEQKRFTRGEIDPLMYERGDVDSYYGGVAELKNCVCLRQGGISTRNGLEYIAELPTGTHRIIGFEVSFDNKYLLVIDSDNIHVYRNGTLIQQIEQTIYSASEIDDINWTTAFDTVLLFHPTIPTQKLLRNSDTEWLFEPVVWDSIPRFDFIPVTTPGTTGITPDKEEGNVKLTAVSATFTTDWVGQYFEGNGGRVRITKFNSTTEVIGYTEFGFYNEDKITDWEYLSGYEDAWSVTRGYPSCGSFYENRLVCGGSKSLPNRIYFSKTDDYFNFDLGSAYDNDSIHYPLDSYNRIVNIVSGRALQIFTIADEYIAVQSLNEPLTPSNINIKKQTAIGSKEGLRVYPIEGSSYFLNSSSLHEFVFDDSVSSYVSNIVSLLSGHLIKNPVDFTVRKDYTNLGATYMALVNEDGRVTMVNVLASQDIMGFSDIYTDGDFINCGTDGLNIYFIIKRTIDGVEKHYLERFNDGAILDSSVLKTGNQPALQTGLDHLEGKTVQIIADGSVLTEQVVESGQITMDRAAEETLEIGLNYGANIKDLPVQTPNQGSVLGFKKNISKIVVDMYETTTMNVNGKEIPFKRFGPAAISPLDKSVQEYTGQKSFYGFRGWDYTGQIKISKVRPGKMTITSIGKKVNF